MSSVSPAPGFPPEPWFLGGDFVVGVFVVPGRDLLASASDHLPRGARPITIAGRAIVGVASVRYAPGGALAYDELLVALPVLWRGGLHVTIPQIWVTSPASRAGGRELWGIPKGLMRTRRRVDGRGLEVEHIGEMAGPGDRLLAAVSARVGRVRLPRWPLPLPTLQRLDGRVIRSRNTVTGIVRTAHTAWRWGPQLAWLEGRRPVLSVAITRAAVVFGDRVQRETDPG